MDYGNFLNSFLENNLEYFISWELNYNKFPKIVRSNSILENYNGVVKRELGKKKETNFINFLNFIKSEDKRFFGEF